jgi:hypothetical protein
VGWVALTGWLGAPDWWVGVAWVSGKVLGYWDQGAVGRNGRMFQGAHKSCFGGERRRIRRIGKRLSS